MLSIGIPHYSFLPPSLLLPLVSLRINQSRDQAGSDVQAVINKFYTCCFCLTCTTKQTKQDLAIQYKQTLTHTHLSIPSPLRESSDCKLPLSPKPLSISSLRLTPYPKPNLSQTTGLSLKSNTHETLILLELVA